MTVYYKLDHSEPGYLSQMLPRADGSWVKRADYEADLAAARTEIERLKGKLQARDGECKGKAEIIAQLEAERDEARAQVAAAYEAAAKICDYTVKYYINDPDDIESVRVTAAEIRDMTPADAKSALEAYGRDKVREGMKRAAEIIRGSCPECQGTGLRDSGGVQPWGEPISVPCDCTDAILAAMEKEGEK